MGHALISAIMLMFIAQATQEKIRGSGGMKLFLRYFWLKEFMGFRITYQQDETTRSSGFISASLILRLFYRDEKLLCFKVFEA
jgi:hypothetical protein